MPDYRLFILNRENHIIDHVEETCDDDTGAVTRARALAKEHAIEIWRARRRIAFVNKGGSAVMESEAQSL